MVDRFWLRDGASLTLGDDGFLPDPEAEPAPGWLREARSSLQIEAVRCLILLGEAGLGKSTALRQQHRRQMESAGSSDSVLLIDLSTAPDPPALRSRMVEAEGWERWHDGAGRLHLFLDSLDGAQMGVRAVGDVLRDVLADAPWDRLSLRIACRTADRCRSLESWLHRHVGPDGFGVYQLLPLRRRDARAVAARHVPDPDRWLDGALEAGLAPLPASPHTLRMLLDISVAGRALPTSRTAVYEAAAQLACREPGERPRAGRRRLADTQRIAARLVLSRRASFAAPATDDVPLRDRAQAEFLCARWLARTASAEEIDRLLFAGTHGAPRVIPHLREVAAALASQSPEFASRLLERDPQVLLRADPAAWPRGHEGVLVDALLAGVGSGRIGRFDAFVRWTLPRLCGATLADELRRVLDDPPAGAAVRETIADLAAACRLRPLEDSLVALARDPGQAPPVRAAAAGALSQFASDSARRRLIPLALEPQDDVADAIKGAALIATWPSVLPFDRLLAALTPPSEESARGAYGDFLRRHLVQGLRADQLAAALAWAAGLPSDSAVLAAVRDELLDALRDQRGDGGRVRERGGPERPRRFDVRSEVASAIALWAGGEVDGFPAALACMEGGDGSRVGDPSDPRRLTGWPLVDEEAREWVVAAAPRYLRTASVPPREWFSGRSSSGPARAGYRALRLLRDEDPQRLALLPDDVWGRWASIIVDWPRDGEVERGFNAWAIAELVERAPDAAAECLNAELARDLHNGHGAVGVRRFAGALTPPLERVVLKHAMRRSTPWQHRAVLIDFLLDEGSEAGWQRARRLVTPSGVRTQPELGVAVASRLAAHAPDGEWRRLWRLIRSDEQFGHRLIELLAAERERPVIERLTEPQLADLFAWIRPRLTRESRRIAHWSDRLLETLAARGSPDAVSAFDRLARALPDIAAVRGMRVHAVEAAWRPVWSPDQAAHPSAFRGTSARAAPRPWRGVPVTWSRLRPMLPAPSWPAAHAAVPIAVVALAALSVGSVRMRSMSDLGLVSVLPVATIVLLLALTWSFCWSLARERSGHVVPLLHVLGLIVMLYGATIFLEGNPRFSIVWRHAGIVDYIDRHHSVDPGLDAYFNWPSFFILGDFFTRLAGFRSLIDFGSWGPLAFNLLFLPPLIATFKWATDDRRALWFAVWVFYSANWVGQDYLAPQAVGYLMWLAIALVLLRWLTPARVSAPAGDGTWPVTAAWKAHRHQLADRLPQLPSAGRRGLVGLVVVLYAAVVMGHQLTPFAILVCATALAVLAGLSPRGLPLLMLVLAAAWILYGAKTYLDGHAGVLLDPLGSVGQNLQSNVGARLAGSPDHVVIVRERLVFTALVWGLAVAGMIRRFRSGRLDIALIAIAVAPALLPIVQPYGGEILLRVFYFVLPPAAFFVAGLIFPRPDRSRSPVAFIIAAGLASVLVVGFLFARYGNERLDYFTPGDVAAVDRLYDIAPRGAVLYAGASNLPWQQRGYELYDYRTVVGLDAWGDGRPRPGQLLAEMRAKGHGRPLYVIITRSTRIRAALLDGDPGALRALTRTLRRSPGVEQVYRRGGASIFRIGPADVGVSPRAARPSPARSPYG